MEQTYCIYKLTNTINDKGYVGFTSNFKRRLREHKKTALKGQGQAVHAAIRKHGWDNFVAEELYYTLDKKHALEIEDYFISLYETKEVKGYNITRGGQSGPPKGFKMPPMSEETKRKISLAKQNPSEEIRQRLREAKQKEWQDPETRLKYIVALNTPEVRGRAVLTLKSRYEDSVFREARQKLMVEIASRPEVKEKMRLVGANISDETRHLRSEAAIRQHSDPILRESHVATTTKANQDPKKRKRIAEAARARWANPEFKAKMKTLYSTPEQKALKSKASKTRWNKTATT